MTSTKPPSTAAFSARSAAPSRCAQRSFSVRRAPVKSITAAPEALRWVAPGSASATVSADGVGMSFPLI